MPASKDIPHLLHLLDDADPLVQERVQTVLLSFGPSLEVMAWPYRDELNPAQAEAFAQLRHSLRQQTFARKWLLWLDMASEIQALEHALGWLAYVENTWEHPRLSDQLDALALRYREQGRSQAIPAFMQFVFEEVGLHAPEKDYYHPDNSNLVQVLLRKEGLQISLSCIAMLLGQRLDLPLHGFNLPGHFMLMAEKEGKMVVYDPFNQGKPLPKPALAYLERSLTLRQAAGKDFQAKPHEVVLRVLRNLINAYQHQADPAARASYHARMEGLIAALKARNIGLR
jgi:regulator of sirC expression with transglutaminase-like and TPR domain